eukprot:4499729-Alexandrium_andersonii.AAC.1
MFSHSGYQLIAIVHDGDAAHVELDVVPLRMIGIIRLLIRLLLRLLLRLEEADGRPTGHEEQ